MIPMLLWAAGPALAQVPVQDTDVGSPVTTERQGGVFGVGVGLGAPTGVVGKLWLNQSAGMQFGVGGDLGRLGDVAGTFDFLQHFRPFSPEGGYSVPLHAGIGLNASANAFELPGTVLVGPRLVGGFSVLIEDLPLDLFVEVAPTLYLIEEVTWSMDGQLGSRYYF